jgi:hypothetical protein
MDLDSYFYGPDDQQSAHAHPPASRKQHRLWRVVRRIAWGRWD